MDIKQYWKEKHDRYKDKDWINKPSIFVKQSVEYFPKSGSVLELGAGQGQDSRFLAQKGYQVLAVDLSPDAIEISKQKAGNKFGNLQFMQLDYSKPLAFPDNKFDVVYSHLGLHYFNEKNTKKLFSDIHRVLKRDGVFASIFNSMDDPEIKEGKQLEGHFYIALDGLEKSYYSVDYVRKLTKNLFKPLVIDNQGFTHKDKVSLIRFIGKKI